MTNNTPKFICQLCGYITEFPAIKVEYINPKRCADSCCNGPVEEYIEQ